MKSTKDSEEIPQIHPSMDNLRSCSYKVAITVADPVKDSFKQEP
jgi:hypothetical protein